MFFVRHKSLDTEHVEMKTGLEAEKINAAARAADRVTRRENKQQGKQSESTDVGKAQLQ